ncbi:MAG: hypothetical protein F4W92_08930 [Gammaproteobacteria bacterium]|nr:hypothetical protein [Gammaproteobacteria bacterium]
MKEIVNALVPSSFGFVGAIIGAICGAYLTYRLANRPSRVLSSLKGEELDFVTGFNKESSFVVAGNQTVRDYDKIHDAALAQWNNNVISYPQILDWLRQGAPGPNGKRTIDKRSSSKPESTATRLVGYVFEDIDT